MIEGDVAAGDDVAGAAVDKVCAVTTDTDQAVSEIFCYSLKLLD
jgi:hypothetical protein